MFVLCALLFGAPAFGQQPDPEQAWATFRQDVMVDWRARVESAEAKREARDRFFDGGGTFPEAFPRLVGARLERNSVVRGRLAALQQRASAREAERQEPFPDLGSESRATEARRARDAALDAEGRADERLGRFLNGVDAHLKRNPGLTSAGLAAMKAPLEALLTAESPTDPDARLAHDLATAAADRDLAALDALQHALMLHAVAGGPLPDPSDSVAALSDPLHDRAAADRLALLRPWLVGPAREEVDTALARWSRGPALERAKAFREEGSAFLASPAATEDEATVEAELADARRELAQAEIALSALAEDAADIERFTALRDGWADFVAAHELRLETIRGEHDTTLDQAAAAAERARREAEEAAKNAKDDARARAIADFLGRAADVSQRVAEELSDKAKRDRAIDAEIAARKGILEGHAKTLREIEETYLLPGTGPDPDKAYGEVRRQRITWADSRIASGEVLEESRQGVGEMRARTAEERKIIEEALARWDTPAVKHAAEEWEKKLVEEMGCANELVALAGKEQMALLDHIREISNLRRELVAYASWREREKDREHYGEDVRREFALLGPTVRVSLSNRVGELKDLPFQVFTDATLFADFLWGLFWTVVLLGGWYWVRGKSSDIAGRLAIQAKRIKPDLRPIDVARVKKPASTAVQAVIDLCLGYLMVGRISPLSPEIAFLVETWLLLAIFRALLSTFDLAVVRAPDFRPSVVALSPSVYDLARFTVRVAIIWGIARGFTLYVLWSMLQLNTVSDLAMYAFTAVGFALSVWLLVRWDPVLRERVRARNQESRLVAALSVERARWLAPFTAMAMLGFFFVSLGVDVVYLLLARDRTGVARLFNVISRYQMNDEEAEDQEPLSEEALAVLTDKRSGHEVYVARPDVTDSLDAAFSGWKKDGRRGMVALVGDRGEGKRTEIMRFLKRNESDDIDCERARIQEVLLDEEGLFEWLSESFGLPRSANAEECIEHLREHERRVFVIEAAHRTFCRSVGGFDAIAQLLYILNATSDHHFWLVTFHRPAWRYLCAIPSIVDVGVFRSVVSLDAMDGTALRELTKGRARTAGLSLDYRTLMRGNLLGADPEVEQERAINGFYRLLAEASEGNPRVAMHLFSACLEPGEDARQARVHTRSALRTEVASELNVDALFTLTALRQQDAMSLTDIVDVTNLPVHTVRNTVRDLQSRGLVESGGAQLYIPIHKLPLVSRTLRRRHLLYLGA